MKSRSNNYRHTRRLVSLTLAAIGSLFMFTAIAQASGCTGANFTQAAGSPISVGNFPILVVSADFNLDGKPDLATANNNSANVTILLGNGSGGFSAAGGSPVAVGLSPIGLVVGDFNMDGKPDLAVANFDNGSVSILLGNGSGGFSVSTILVGSSPNTLVVGDFNLDGKPDLAITNKVASGTVTILLGNGNGGFSPAAGSPISVGSFPYSVASGDFNLDGKPDLAVTNFSSASVTILLGNGSGGFSPAAGSPISVNANPGLVVVSDFNLDGKPDLAVATVDVGSNLYILLGNGSGGFVPAAGSPISVAGTPIFVTASDFNLDGKPDLALTNFNDVVLLFGDGTGGFAQPVGSPITVGSSPRSVAVADFNLDGKPDFAAANGVSNDITIELNTCNATPCSGVSLSPAVGSPVGVGTAPSSTVTADFNLDGKPDLAVANTTSNNVTILLGNGSGGFTQAAGSPVAVPVQPNVIVVGDFNMDGKPDLAVTFPQVDSVSILLGNGSGGFSVSTISGFSFPWSVAVGDFNLDGKPDLAVTNDASSGTVTVLLGNGSGGFTAAAGSPVSVGSFPKGVAVGDFNLDGKPDLAVGNQSSNNLTILLGNGSGGFTQSAGSPVGTGNAPAWVTTGDFNLDGRPDLAVANFSSNSVTILLGNGSGGFTVGAGSPVSTGAAPIHVAVGDFNLDGKPDLAVANIGSTVTILRGDGSGGFTQPSGSPITVVSSPRSVAVADFNLDGRPDFATANANSNNVTIELNTCGATPTPTPPTIQFSSSSYTISETGPRVDITLTRGGDTTSSASVSFATIDGAGLTNCNVFNGIASPRCDYINTIGTATWAAGDATSKTFPIAIVDDSYAEGSETFTIGLNSPSGATLGAQSTATVTITDNDATTGPNPVDNTNFFVRQQYIDFLGREPDPLGFAGWTATINNCAPNDTNCDRIHVSQQFFQSAEFQSRGYFVYRFYPVAFGRKPDYAEFVPDLASVSGFLDNNQLEAAKVAFITSFMARTAFVSTYNSLNNTQYVDALLNTAGVTLLPSPATRQALIDGLNNATLTRAQVLRQIVESGEVAAKYNHQAYAVMEYFGYLRRQPDAFYLQWIAVLDSTNDPRGMVTGFVNSTEYRQRFGP